jgi:hypothetical protein
VGECRLLLHALPIAADAPLSSLSQNQARLNQRFLSSIADVAEKYAVAFLNSEGWKIYRGVRGSDQIVVEVTLSFQERDPLRQSVTSKLVAIRPAVDPTAFRIVLHPVGHPAGTPDIGVAELVI